MVSAAPPLQPTQETLRDAIRGAARAALRGLFDTHREDFYYVTLVTTGEALRPCISAWSTQALAARVAQDGPDSKDWLEWSYADSPYFCHGDAHFEAVARLFLLRPGPQALPTTEAWQAEYELRLEAMESAMRQLDGEGLFGQGDERLRICVLVEVVPPDASNAERARRLNPPNSPALHTWLNEAGEQ